MNYIKQLKLDAKKFANRMDRFVAKVASIQHAPKFAYFGIIVLGITTLVWSILGASAQQANSDQLINSYLFGDYKTFQASELPGAHSFLIKWPLFYLVNLMRSRADALIVLTVLVVLITIGFLVYILRKIEKRPLVIGVLCLALASVLLLVPAQPVDGTPLPLNMAMLATRNIEYVFFIGSLMLLIDSPRLKARNFWLGVGTLGLLIASDKLFLTLTIGGALLSLIAYSLAKGWNLVSLSTNWLLGSVGGYIVGLLVLAGVKSTNITHVVSQSTAGPYSLIANIHDLILGSIYGVLNIFSNFGANPAYDAGPLRTIPSIAMHRLLSPAGPAYIVNFLILITGLVLSWKIIKYSFGHNKDKTFAIDRPSKLSIALIWVSLASLGSYILTKHYYPVDGRYLAIILFALFVASATYLKQVNLDSKKIVYTGILLSLTIISGLIGVNKTYTNEMKVTSDLKTRNKLVARAIAQHRVNSLVGDYWRVIPTKSYLNRSVNVIPLSDCSNPRIILASQSWQRNLQKTSFAYLLTLEKSQTDFPVCNLNQIISQYGRPNASALIAGTQDNPKELLLFYDNGANNSAPSVNINIPSTILPISPTELPYTSCPTGKSIMNITAHQDDDLLFMNPDTLRSLQAGDCIRSVYLTAGDAGNSELYWLGREQGSEAAYATMETTDNIWVKRIVKLSDKEYIHVSHPRGDYKVSIIFFRLPDGNLKGQGFRQYLYESLAKLDSGGIPTITSVDGQSNYTKDQLVAALAEVMKVYGVDEIRTQSNYASGQYPDHSDHMAVGRLTQLAYKNYTLGEFENTIQVPLSFYTGYPVREQPVNITGSDLIAKESAFLAYSRFDGSVCHSHADCLKTLTYGAYLSRQYQKSN